MTSSCDRVRASVSVALDGRTDDLPVEELEAHLAECAACRQWREDAHRITRQFRLQPAAAPGSPPAALFEAVRATRRGFRPWVTVVVRWALVGVAVAQLVVTGPLMISGDIDGFRDLGSLDVALAFGYLVAAVRPRRAAGMRAVVGAAALLLLISALLDLTAHRTTLSDEAPHVITLCGWVLVMVLASRTEDVGDPPSLGLRARLETIAAWFADPIHRRTSGVQGYGVVSQAASVATTAGDAAPGEAATADAAGDPWRAVG